MRYTTGKREKIIEFFSQNANSSYSLEEICREILDSDKGKSTVYRLVSELVADGKIKRISDGLTRHCTYQYMGGAHCHNHLHLKCKGCGKLIHLDEKLSHEFEDKVRNVGGFTIEEGTLLLGTCIDCMGGVMG